ncbi:amiloride-sensitive sodium channel subunit beta [Trichonephila clavipes]|uniref:Amiloride-sensitive sodium channel subunit beta n=1 Tax=Trichonephila clavipes TaxID=2585209 RepID=A0A8X6REZ4_TRICX|nr:amiloride-sensitive sodium channel subunit beta [Trichonephila clavipes]
MAKGSVTPVVSRSFEYHTDDLTRSHPNFEGEHPRGGQGPPTSLLLQPTSREGLRLDGYLKYHHAAKALYIYKHQCLLRDSNPGPSSQQSASLISILDGILHLIESYIDKQFEMLRQMTQTLHLNNSMNPSEIDPTAFCYKSIDEFLYRSKTVDLSDIWMSLTVTKDSLQKFGHQEEDLIIHCTYNARNCYNRTYSIVAVNAYPSPRYGLCHTISVNQLSLQNVTTPGLALGLRLTLNIQREEYLNLLSPEYGARLLVHPAGTYPTLQRGGVVLQPGTKTYVSVRMRKIDRLPWPYGECTYEFEHSPLASHLRKTGQRELLKHRIYTYEYCQTLCRDAYLLKQCDCSEEITQGNSRFCDPCNITQALCRTNFLRKFNRNPRSRECNKFCKPACSDIRYDLTVSRSEWPNSQHQYFILKRWPLLREKFGPAASDGNYSGQGDGQMPFDLKYIK